jgi:hypothetical protein
MKKQRKPRPGKTKKPGAAVAAHSPRAVPRLVKRTVLLWVGYMLAALAVFGGMKDFFELADLVRTLTWKWDNWNHLLWATVFGYDPDKFPPGFAIRLTFLAALLIISISAQIADERQQEDKSKVPENYWVEVLRDIENFKFGQAFFIVYLSIFTFNFAIDKLIFKSDSIIFLEERPVLMAVALGISLAVLVAILFYRGISEFGHTLLLIAFMSSFYFALAYTGANSAVASGRDMVAVYREVLLKGNFFVGYIHMTAILQIAPPKYFNMRFYNIIIFVMLITLLNYAIILKERLS